MSPLKEGMREGGGVWKKASSGRTVLQPIDFGNRFWRRRCRKEQCFEQHLSPTYAQSKSRARSGGWSWAIYVGPPPPPHTPFWPDAGSPLGGRQCPRHPVSRGGGRTWGTGELYERTGVAFSVRGPRRCLLGLQSFLCSSSTRGCLRAWQFPVHSLVSESACPHDVSCYHIALWDDRPPPPPILYATPLSKLQRRFAGQMGQCVPRLRRVILAD